MLIKMRFSINTIVQYFWIYMMIQFIGGRVNAALGSDVFYGLMLTLSGVYFLMHYRRQITSYGNILGMLALILLLMFLTVVKTGGGLSIASSLSAISRFLVVLVAIDVNRTKFIDRFLKTTYCFAVISLILFAFVQILGVGNSKALFSNLYEIPNGNWWMDGTYGVFLIVYNYMDASRNAYMFGEPGEYQMLIMVGLYLLLFCRNELGKKEKTRYLIIFLITMMTIQSTTGFFSLAVFFFCVLLHNKKDTIQANIKRLCVIFICLAFAFMMFGGGMAEAIINQVSMRIFNSVGKFDLAVSTGKDRVSAILTFVDLIKNRPDLFLLGIGYTGVIQYFGVFSCSGIINSFVMFGGIVCIVLYGMIIWGLWKKSSSNFEFIFLLFFVLNNGLSQPDLLSIMTVMLACCGLLRINRTRERESSRMSTV